MPPLTPRVVDCRRQNVDFTADRRPADPLEATVAPTPATMELFKAEILLIQVRGGVPSKHLILGGPIAADFYAVDSLRIAIGCVGLLVLRSAPRRSMKPVVSALPSPRTQRGIFCKKRCCSTVLENHGA